MKKKGIPTVMTTTKEKSKGKKGLKQAKQKETTSSLVACMQKSAISFVVPEEIGKKISPTQNNY